MEENEEKSTKDALGNSESSLSDLLAFRNIFEAIKSGMEDVGYWSIEGFTNQPGGTKQPCASPMFDHEYVDQSCGIAGDDYTGHVFLPMGNGEYIQIYFES